jgi:hypothetical protein
MTGLILLACPDPPPEIAADLEERSSRASASEDPGGKAGDPDRMDLSAGGTMLLDLDQVRPQLSQETLAESSDPMVRISGELKGTCDGGDIRIDVIELGIEHDPTGPMIGPVTSLSPEAPGPYTLLVPKGKNVQIAALCDIDQDQKIVQGTDKLAPGIALGVVEEDKEGVTLAFSGEGGRETPLPVGAPEAQTGPGDAPPGDATASTPSAEDGAEEAPEG